METIFRLKESELDKNFLSILKTLFKGRRIEISVTSDFEEDETEYLFKSPANKKRLLEAIKNVEENKNLISFSAEEFEVYGKKLLKK